MIAEAPAIAAAPPREAYRPFAAFVYRFKQNRLAVGGTLVIGFFFLLSFVFWLFSVQGFQWPYDPAATEVSAQLLPPSIEHWLGTDQLGRDVFSRMMHGARVSLMVGFVAVGISLTIGILVGAVAGFFGGWVDNLLMRFVDVVISFPSFFLILTVVALLSPSFWNVMVVIGLTGWTGTARFVRAEFLSIKERDYVQSARALGAGHRRIIFRHMLPNSLAPVLVSATLGVAGGHPDGGGSFVPRLWRPASYGHLGEHPDRGAPLYL